MRILPQWPAASIANRVMPCVKCSAVMCSPVSADAMSACVSGRNQAPLPLRTVRMCLHTAYLAMGRCRTNRFVVIIYIVANRINETIVVDVCSVILIVAGGAQPPPGSTRVCSLIPEIFYNFIPLTLHPLP